MLALAPDGPSVNAARSTASRARWSATGCDHHAVWGECKGTGKKPYQVAVDLSVPAYGCTCPSRKVPCKHALALLLLWSDPGGTVVPGVPPQSVARWLEDRAGRAQRPAARRARRSGEVADPAARARRAEQRARRVAAGVESVSLWLRDLVRHGFAQAHERPYSFWNDAAARAVDDQIPRVARRLRAMAETAGSGEGWPQRLLEDAAKLHLLTEAYGRLDSLDEVTRAEVHRGLGFPVSRDEVLSRPAVADRWDVLGRVVYEDEYLSIRRTWLLGRSTGRPALLVDSAGGGVPLRPGLPAGTFVEAALSFYPGAQQLRALVAGAHQPPVPMSEWPGDDAIAEALEPWVVAAAANPWLESWPLVLRDVIPAPVAGGWEVRDARGDALPLRAADAVAWQLMAISGGDAIGLFGEWRAGRLSPVTAWAGTGALGVSE